MRLGLAVLLALVIGSPLKATTLQQTYLNVFLGINEAERSELGQDYVGALVRFQVAEAFLVKMHAWDPNWEIDLLTHRIRDCQEKITALTPLAGKELRLSHDAWPINGQDLGIAAWPDVSRAQAKLTFWQLMRANHPTWYADTIEGKIREGKKLVDDLVTDKVKKAIASASDGTGP